MKNAFGKFKNYIRRLVHVQWETQSSKTGTNRRPKNFFQIVIEQNTVLFFFFNLLMKLPENRSKKVQNFELYVGKRWKIHFANSEITIRHFDRCNEKHKVPNRNQQEAKIFFLVLNWPKLGSKKNCFFLSYS